jgi:peptidoglycan/xylan/chitin deacetylase (PgdA/CDA1 family)
MREQHLHSSRLPVLMYHRIGHACAGDSGRHFVTPQTFGAQMQALAHDGWRACSLSSFAAWRSGVPLPPRSFLLTFDDGYLGVYEHAFPAVRRLGWPAVVFVVTSEIGGCDSWTRQHRNHALLGPRHITEMRAADFTFQSHSRTHRDLASLDSSSLIDELVGSRRDLEKLLGEPVSCLAYPYGHYNGEVIDAAQRSGYELAFTVEPGFNRSETDPYRIRRLDVFDTDTPARLLRKLSFGSNDGRLSTSLRYYANRLLRKPH